MNEVFKALADQNRRKILTILKRLGSASVSQILSYLSVGQATVSSHLSVLRKSGLVECRVSGKNRIYKLSEKNLSLFVDKLNRFLGEPEKDMVEEIIVRR